MVILDIDEMIVPVSTDNWHDMMTKVRSLKSGKTKVKVPYFSTIRKNVV